MDNSKYNNLQPVLQEILTNHVSLPDDEVKKNNEVLDQILNLIQNELSANNLYKHLFRRKFYGGSYYDGHRVAHPNEFDIDFLFRLPDKLKARVERSNENGFVDVKINNLDGFKRQPDLMEKYGDLLKFIDNDNYLQVHTFLNWFWSVAQKNLYKFLSNGYYIFPIAAGTSKAKQRTKQPAFTLNIYHTSGDHLMDVDLVPCLLFGKENWPAGSKTCPLSSNPTQKDLKKSENFLVVPKPCDNENRKWRLSFQEQERLILQNKQNLRPVLKLLKQMRDVLRHTQIKSYYIKTIFIWLATTKDEEYWKNTISFIFMESLMYYSNRLKEGRISYFWDDEYNLLNHIDIHHLISIGNELSKIIKKIESNLAHPDVVKEILINKKN